MHDEIYMSNYINDLMSLIKHLAEIGTKVDEYDDKAILLNNLSSKYNNALFTLSQMSSQSLEGMIASILVEENRMNEGDIDASFQTKIALFSKGKMRKTSGLVE